MKIGKILGFLFLGVTAVLTFPSCHGHEEEPCTEPVEYDSVEPTHWGLLRHQNGDTLYFKKYEVKKDSGRKYMYLGEESFVAGQIDTS